MRSEVIVVLDGEREYRVDTQALPTVSSDEGRRWLDQQFVSLDCEPLRATGKVLLADKVLGIAGAYGYDKLKADPALAREFAQQVALARGRPRVSVDVAGLVVAY